MNDRPTVNYLDYLMKDKLIYWLSVFVSQTMKITWITEDVRGGNQPINSIIFYHLLLICSLKHRLDTIQINLRVLG